MSKQLKFEGTNFVEFLSIVLLIGFLCGLLAVSIYSQFRTTAKTATSYSRKMASGERLSLISSQPQTGEVSFIVEGKCSQPPLEIKGLDASIETLQLSKVCEYRTRIKFDEFQAIGFNILKNSKAVSAFEYPVSFLLYRKSVDVVFWYFLLAVLLICFIFLSFAYIHQSLKRGKEETEGK